VSAPRFKSLPDPFGHLPRNARQKRGGRGLHRILGFLEASVREVPYLLMTSIFLSPAETRIKSKPTDSAAFVPSPTEGGAGRRSRPCSGHPHGETPFRTSGRTNRLGCVELHTSCRIASRSRVLVSSHAAPASETGAGHRRVAEDACHGRALDEEGRLPSTLRATPAV
jgi:hypothetical protein